MYSGRPILSGRGENARCVGFQGGNFYHQEVRYAPRHGVPDVEPQNDIGFYDTTSKMKLI